MISNLHVGHLPKNHLADVRHLKDAFEGIEQACRDWRSANLDKLNVARFHASQHVIARHGELCRAIRELHELARQIFSERIKSLGLGEAKVGELFRGSADAVRFASIEQPSLGDLRLAYSDGGSDAAYFIEKTPANMVALLRGWEATTAEVAKLTTMAKKELAAAKRVSAAA